MKINPNYFFVNRELLHSDRWLGEPFTRGQAWVDLFGLAQHTDGFFRVRGVKVIVKRSQLGYSQVTLAKRWKWSRGKVRRYLNELENNGDIVQQKTNETTIITIVKYDLWQGDRTASSTANGQQTDSKRYTYKKVKNDKKDEIDEQSLSSKGKKEGLNTEAVSLQRLFMKLCKEELGKSPIWNKAGYTLLCRALKNFSAIELKQSLVDWFNESKQDEDLIQITQALSANRLNRWKINQ